MGGSAQRPKAAKAFDETGNVILLGSFSKTISPALRLGWLAPGRYRDQIQRQKFLLNISSATVPQLALADFLKGNRYRRATQSAGLIYARRLRRLRDEVLKAFPDGTTCSVPVGGIFLWVALPRSYGTMVLFERALEDEITFSPGRLFTRSGDYRNCLRLSCATIDEDQIPHAIARLRTLMVPSE
jgi:DNA-binding transcriptional MocR family regulator